MVQRQSTNNAAVVYSSSTNADYCYRNPSRTAQFRKTTDRLRLGYAARVPRVVDRHHNAYGVLAPRDPEAAAAAERYVITHVTPRRRRHVVGGDARHRVPRPEYVLDPVDDSPVPVRYAIMAPPPPPPSSSSVVSAEVATSPLRFANSSTPSSSSSSSLPVFNNGGPGRQRIPPTPFVVNYSRMPAASYGGPTPALSRVVAASAAAPALPMPRMFNGTVPRRDGAFGGGSAGVCGGGRTSSASCWCHRQVRATPVSMQRLQQQQLQLPPQQQDFFVQNTASAAEPELARPRTMPHRTDAPVPDDRQRYGGSCPEVVLSATGYDVIPEPCVENVRMSQLQLFTVCLIGR